MTSECPPPPKLQPNEQAGKAGEIAKAMGIGACETDQMSATFQANADMWIASMQMQATFNKSSTIGCEQLYLAAEAFNQSQQNITCVLKKNTSNVSKTISAGNKIRLIAGKDVNIMCTNGLNIDQSININMMDLTQLTIKEMTEISDEVKHTVEAVSKLVQDSNTGLGATPQGQKTIKDMVSNINDSVCNEAVTDTINNISLSVNADNDIMIESGGNITISGNQCNINQDIVLQIISSTILSDSMTSVFKNIGEVVAKSDEETKQLGINKGADSLQQSIFGTNYGYIIIFIIILVICYFLWTNRDSIRSAVGPRRLR